MKNNIKQVFDESIHDGCVFSIYDRKYVDLSAFTYKDPGIPEQYDLGYRYHILTYRYIGGWVDV